MQGMRALTQGCTYIMIFGVRKTSMWESGQEHVSDRPVEKKTELCTIHSDETLCRVWRIKTFLDFIGK